MIIEGLGLLEIENLRGLRKIKLDLGMDAAIVVLSGANGTGKTSTCTAISLLLNGPAFEPGAEVVHVSSTEALVVADVVRSGVPGRRSTTYAASKKPMSSVRDDDSEPRAVSEADAKLPRRASVFFQDDLSVDLASLVQVLLADVPAVQVLRERLATAWVTLDAVEREFPSRALDDSKQLRSLRREAIARFVGAWSSVDVWMDSAGIATPRRDPSDLLLTNLNVPKAWHGRLHGFVSWFAEMAGFSLTLGPGVTTEQVLAALVDALETAQTRQVAAKSPPPIHIADMLVRARVPLVAVGEGLDDPGTEETLPLPIDAHGMAEVRTRIAAGEARVNAYRLELPVFHAAQGWPKGAAASLEQVLTALAEEGGRWNTVPDVPGVLTAELSAALRPGLADAVSTAVAALLPLRAWQAQIQDLRGRWERVLHEEELRLGMLRALLDIGERLVSEGDIWAGVRTKLVRTRRINADVLARLLAEARAAGVPGSTVVDRPLAVVVEAVGALQDVERRIAAAARAEAEDRAREAALSVLKEAKKALEALVPRQKRMGDLDRAAGIRPESVRELTEFVNRVSKHHFRSTQVTWDIKLDKDQRSLVPAARVMASTADEISLAGASTGERTIAGICLTVALHLILEDRVGHRVLVFDDFTTAFDLAQLPAVALLLRKLAWNSTKRRKLVLSSHHEEITNRLLEVLAPPGGETLRVLQFQPVQDVEMHASGGRVETYEAQGESGAGQGDGAPTAEDLFRTLLSDGVAYLEEEPEAAVRVGPTRDGVAGLPSRTNV